MLWGRVGRGMKIISSYSNREDRKLENHVVNPVVSVIEDSIDI